MIVVEARNGMLAESTTLHWHGIPQKGTPYMDGVGYIGQCPILPGEKFQYIFFANVSGTYFWHSHIGNCYSKFEQKISIFAKFYIEIKDNREPSSCL